MMKKETDGASGTAKEIRTVNIVGAGLAGLSASVHLAMAGMKSRLISSQPSERAQSVLAAGGINGALNTMGEDDRTEYHYRDTMKAGCDIADPAAVRNLTEHAPEVLRWLAAIGVPFQRKGNVIQQRNFGGQKKKRTAYAKSSTGKALMTALIDEARRWEAEGMITRYARHDFVRLLFSEEQEKDRGGRENLKYGCGNENEVSESAQRSEGRGAGTENVLKSSAASKADRAPDQVCAGLVIRDNVTGELYACPGPVLMAAGGLNGLFPGRTTGTTANTADPAAILFSEGVLFSNLEMVQFHPTTLSIPGKRLLISEAARGEGGRLFIRRNGENWYFMEEKYPELKNLMPRDVVSREEYFVMHDSACEGQVFLDCTGLSREIWQKKLSDLRQEVIYYTGLDPAKKPIPIEPGIHYFMGGIHTDSCHRTNIPGLYAAGECCSLYHGANRLGGNSTLGAVYGGQKAAETIARDIQTYRKREDTVFVAAKEPVWNTRGREEELGEILYESLGVVRDAETMEKGCRKLKKLLEGAESPLERKRILLGLAMLESAIFRKESRGAQYRSDYPERDPEFAGAVTIRYQEKHAGNPFLIGVETYGGGAEG